MVLSLTRSLRLSYQTSRDDIASKHELEWFFPQCFKKCVIFGYSSITDLLTLTLSARGAVHLKLLRNHHHPARNRVKYKHQT